MIASMTAAENYPSGLLTDHIFCRPDLPAGFFLALFALATGMVAVPVQYRYKG